MNKKKCGGTPVTYCMGSFIVATSLGLAALLMFAAGWPSHSLWVTLQMGLFYLAGPALMNLASLLPVMSSKRRHFALFGAAAATCVFACLPLSNTPSAGGVLGFMVFWCWFSAIVHFRAFEDWAPSTRWLHSVVLTILAFGGAVGIGLVAPFAPFVTSIVCGALIASAVLVHATALWYLRRSEVELSSGQNEDVWPYLSRANPSLWIERQPKSWYELAHDAMRSASEQIGESFKTRMVRKMDPCALLHYLGHYRYRWNDPLQLAREAMACCTVSLDRVPLDTALVHLQAFPELDGENTEKHAFWDALNRRVCSVGHLDMQEVLVYLKHAFAPSPRGTNSNLERFGHALKARACDLDKRAAVVFAMHEPMHASEMLEAMQLDNWQSQEQLDLPALDLDNPAMAPNSQLKA